MSVFVKIVDIKIYGIFVCLILFEKRYLVFNLKCKNLNYL